MAEGGANGWEVGSKSKDGGYFPTGALFSSTTYYITCSNSAGSDNDSVTVNVGQQGNAPTVDLSADDTSINDGESTTLRWTTGNNPTSCTASGDWSGSKSISGSSQSTGSLTSTKTYNISCSNSFGSNNDSVTVSVNDINRDQPDVTTRSATDIEENEATLRGEVDGNGLSTRVWFEWGEDRDDVEDGDGEETDEMSTGSGTDSFDEDIDGLDEDTIYYFRAVARNSEGTDYGSVLSFRTDEDGGNDGDVNVDLRADRTRLGYGDSTTLRWDSDNADSCRALRGTGGWSGSKNRSGSFNTGALYNTTTYEISCEDNNDEDRFGDDSGGKSDCRTDSATADRGNLRGLHKPRLQRSNFRTLEHRQRDFLHRIRRFNRLGGDEKHRSGFFLHRLALFHQNLHHHLL